MTFLLICPPNKFECDYNLNVLGVDIWVIFVIMINQHEVEVDWDVTEIVIR